MGGGLVAKLSLTLSTTCAAACQAPLSMGFSKQEYWSELPFPSPGDLPDPGIEPTSLASPALAGELFTTVPSEEAEAKRPLCSHISFHQEKCFSQKSFAYISLCNKGC